MADPVTHPKTRFVARLDSDKNAGWQLRLPKRHPQGPLTHYFADAAYGGSDKALAAAIAMRDRMFASAGLPVESYDRSQPNKKRVNDGLPLGISFGDRKHRVRLARFQWIAFGSRDGKQLKKVFAVKMTGFEQALDLAVQWRFELTGMRPTPEQYAVALDYKKKLEDTGS